MNRAHIPGGLPSARRILRLCVAAAIVPVLACSKSDSASASSAGQPAEGTPAAGEATGAVGASGTATSASDITPQAIALGNDIFHGKAAGGICYTCHGMDAKGTQLAPNLTDDQWINGDGSYDFIVNTVQHGVPTPKEHAAPMPAFGPSMTPEQVHAVAAYVFSLSHPTA